MEQEERNYHMLHDPLQVIIPKLAGPTIVSMLVTSIYNMADTFFVSQIGTSASAAVGVIFSAMSFLQALAYTFGIGTGNNISRQLGAGESGEAERYASVGFYSCMLVGVVIAVLGNLFLEPLVYFLGSTETIAPYAMDYARYIFWVAPFTMGGYAMNNLLRFEGMSNLAMIGIATGGVLNIALDPLFIFGLGLGTSGAALATALSQLISFGILFGICSFKKGPIRLKLSQFRPTLTIYKHILYTGMPSLGRQGVASVSSVVLNTVARPYGDAVIASFAIVNRVVLFINAAVVGFGQGFQPVCGFSFGARDYRRVRKAFWYCVKVSTVILLLIGGACFPLARALVTAFRRSDPEVIRIGTQALRMQLVTVPLWGYMTMSNMFSQTIGYGVRATVISMSRQGIFLIPALLILPPLFGVLGLQLALPVADITSTLLAFILVQTIMRDFNRLEKELEKEKLGQPVGD